MSATAVLALTANDFEQLEIDVDTIGWTHGRVTSGKGGWLVHGESRYLRLLAAACAEAADKSDAAAQLAKAVS